MHNTKKKVFRRYNIWRLILKNKLIKMGNIMDRIIIGIAYILAIYLFYNLIRIRIKQEENRRNKIYVLIVLILALIIIWNIFRI